MILYSKGSTASSLSADDLKNGLFTALDTLGDRKKILIIPPDYTRYHSRAGELTAMAYSYYGDKIKDILPALGTHFAMSDKEIASMFRNVPRELFRVHDWRNQVETIGTVPADFVEKVSDGVVQFDWPAQVNRMLINGGYDLILSIGQVVPHEVIGMANYNKNIFVGTGGAEGINKSHFIGAAYGMERMMGRADTPVRRILNYASEHFANKLPIVYAHTVIGRSENGGLATRGLYIGDDEEVFQQAADLSLKVNFEMLEEPIDKIVVYLDPSEFKSTWLGNKSIYRTRMAIADNGELIVLAPGLKEFGEDPEIDKLIRKYGYAGTPKVMKYVENTDDLKNNLSAAAHLIHGSSEGRFSITYCPGKLTKEEIESVNFRYADLQEMTKKYNPKTLQDGYNVLDSGEKIFYISNPAIGLWAYKEKFNA